MVWSLVKASQPSRLSWKLQRAELASSRRIARHVAVSVRVHLLVGARAVRSCCTSASICGKRTVAVRLRLSLAELGPCYPA